MSVVRLNGTPFVPMPLDFSLSGSDVEGLFGLVLLTRTLCLDPVCTYPYD